MEGPGYLLGQFLAEHGAQVTIGETVYEHVLNAEPPGPFLVEHITVTLPGGEQLGMKVRFEENA